MDQLNDEEIETLREFVEGQKHGVPFTLRGIGNIVDSATKFGARVRETCENAAGKVPFLRIHGYLDHPMHGRQPVKSADNLILYVRR
jgi:hypothetical protein